MTALLLEDHHVHSTFSDGTSTLEENIATAVSLGLRRLGCVDHVRADTTYVPAYTAAVRALQTPGLELTAGIEAKIMDISGRLDLPADDLDGVDRIYVADHQFPWLDGPRSPRALRESIANGDTCSDQCIEMLVQATIAAMRCNRSHPLVVAHLFSILPKMGLAEDEVPVVLLRALGEAAAETGTLVEISERWHCPSVRTLRAVRTAGATLVCSTDSHGVATIGRYTYVRATLRELTA